MSLFNNKIILSLLTLLSLLAKNSSCQNLTVTSEIENETYDDKRKF